MEENMYKYKVCFYDENKIAKVKIINYKDFWIDWECKYKPSGILYDESGCVLNKPGVFKAWFLPTEIEANYEELSKLSANNLKTRAIKKYGRNYGRALVEIFGYNMLSAVWNIHFYDETNPKIPLTDAPEIMYLGKVLNNIDKAGLYTDIEDIRMYYKQLDNILGNLEMLENGHSKGLEVKI